MTNPASTDLTGSILAGRYRILRKLGEGAMGTVYLGEHVKIGRQDAIKVLRDVHAGDTEAIARFNRGARNVAAIRHPNVCTIYDYSDTGDGAQFLAMQFVPGDSLKELLDREGVLSLERAVSIAKQTADALEAAHDAGIVHRDLKPANIMISEGRRGDDLVTVVDFDIAKGSQEGEGSEVTRLGFVVGTPEYMSPEQLTGDRLDGRSDVYSLALVLFRMISGSLPFSAESTQDLMIQRLTRDPLRLDEVAPGFAFPPSMQPLFDRALARKADDRHADAAEFGRELLEATGMSHVTSQAGRGGTASTSGLGGRPARADDEIPATRVAAPIGVSSASAASGATTRRRSPAMMAGAGIAVVGIAALAFFALRGPSGKSDLGGAQTVATVAEPGNSLVADAGPGTGLPGTPDDERAADPPPASGGGGTTGGGQPAQPGNASTAPPVTTAPPPAPPPAPPSAPTISIPVADASDIVFRQFENLGPPTPGRPSLTAIRDTAEAVWGLNGAPTADRAMAAYVVGSAWLALGDAGRCASWLERAIELRPDGPGYSVMLANCQRVGG